MADNLPTDLEDETPEQVRARVAKEGLPDDLEAAPTPVATGATPPQPHAAKSSTWNAMRDVAEGLGMVPSGVIPDEATARGAVASILQGPAMQWADEVAGLAAASRTMPWDPKAKAQIDERTRAYVAGGMSSDDAQRRALGDVLGLGGTLYREGRDKFRAIENDFRNEHPAAAFALTTAGGALGNPVSVKGGGALNLLRFAPAAAEGAISGAGAAEEKEGMGLAAATGAPLGVAGQALGEAAGDIIGAGAQRASSGATGRVAAAEAKAQEMAAKKVAEATASAKGKLGSVTQEANRAVENLLRLQEVGGMTPEQQAQLATLRDSGVLSTLHQKLADSMLDQVPNAAGRIDIARAAYEGLRDNEPAAAAAAAQDILSGAEAKRQVGDRLKRYLPTIVGAVSGMDKGGMVGGALTGLALDGSPSSALIGGLSGAALRPALRAGQRMLQHPAVQRAMFSPVSGVADAIGGAARSVLPEVGSAASRTWRGSVEGGSPTESTSAMMEQIATQAPEQLGPYAQKIQQAVADGNLPLVHYTLQQTDPRYRALVERARTGDSQ